MELPGCQMGTRVPRQAELTAPVAALIPWPRMSQREQGADPQYPRGRVDRGDGAGVRRGVGNVYQCADLSLLANPSQLAKLVCLDAAKAVKPKLIHPASVTHLSSILGLGR